MNKPLIVSLGVIIPIGAIIITLVLMAYSQRDYDFDGQIEDKRLEPIDSKTMQEIKQAIQFQKENPDVDMFCLEKTRQHYKEIGIEDLYEQAYQNSCIEQEKQNGEEINPETFCTLKMMEFYQSLGMGDIYHELATKNC